MAKAGDLDDRKAVCPGSYDPVTWGHLDVIARAARLFDSLHVAVVANPSKSALFSLEERLALLRRELEGLDVPRKLEVVSFSGLTVDLARRLGARWILRGLRSSEDAGYELPMALSNRRAGVVEVETVFLAASPETAFISSTLVREIAANRGELTAFVPPAVEKALRGKFPRAT
jgi:pantetheine-phosphate adenylyltransferase